MDKYVLPALRGRDMKSVTPQDVLSIVRRIHERYPSSARGVRTIISQVFAYAMASGLVDWNPAVQVVGALPPLPPVAHRSVLQTEDDARSAIRALKDYEGNRIVKLCLLLLAYTFVRPSEARCAEWSELDGDLWTIPAGRMKMKRPHVVPLSSQASAIFDELRDIGASARYVFALPTYKKPFSSPLLCKTVKDMGLGATPHAFRGLASTLLNEHGFAPDVIERQLAHVETNAVRAAYNRAEYLDKRRDMLQWWADYLDGLAK